MTKEELLAEFNRRMTAEFNRRMTQDCPSEEAFFPYGGDSYDFSEEAAKAFVLQAYDAGATAERERIIDKIKVTYNLIAGFHGRKSEPTKIISDILTHLTPPPSV